MQPYQPRPVLPHPVPPARPRRSLLPYVIAGVVGLGGCGTCVYIGQTRLDREEAARALAAASASASTAKFTNLEVTPSVLKGTCSSTGQLIGLPRGTTVILSGVVDGEWRASKELGTIVEIASGSDTYDHVRCANHDPNSGLRSMHDRSRVTVHGRLECFGSMPQLSACR